MDCRLPDITVHYEAFGDGRPLVVLPGWPDDWQVPADYLEPVFRGRPGWRRFYLQRRSQSGDTKRTIVGLLNELQTAADLLKDDCGTRPAQAVRRVHRAFSALRDTALAVRTSSFGMASLAARMEYTTVWPEIERLMAANGGIALADGVARASEISELCSDLQNLLAGD